MTGPTDPLTAEEESFLVAYLNEGNRQRCVNGDMARAWMVKLFATVQMQRRQLADQASLIFQEGERIVGLVELLSKRADHGQEEDSPQCPDPVAPPPLP